MTTAVQINEATCYHAPPHVVLDVAMVGDVVFLTISDYDQDDKTTTIVKRDEICVDAATLFNAMMMMSLHEQSAEKRRSAYEAIDCDANDVR